MYRKAAAVEMNDVFLKVISTVRKAKEDQKRLTEQWSGAGQWGWATGCARLVVVEVPLI